MGAFFLSVKLAKGLLILFYLFMHQLFDFIDPLYCSFNLYFMNFYNDLYYFFPSTWFGFSLFLFF